MRTKSLQKHAVFDRIVQLLDRSSGQENLFPPTEIYNEGWMLRLVLDFFSEHAKANHPLFFMESARWFSEALLPSAFLPRHSGDALAETWTHSDGVIGHFHAAGHGKAGLTLPRDARQFAVVEAKMFSPLSPGVTHAPYFNQAARSVACIAEALKRAPRRPEDLTRLAFVLIAPSEQFESGVFSDFMNKESIADKVARRVAAYDGEKDSWHSVWFTPTLATIDIDCITWEDLIAEIERADSEYGEQLKGFYQDCMQFNRPVLQSSDISAV